MRLSEAIEEFTPVWKRFPHLIPARPYCTDVPSSGLLIRPRDKALSFRNIQFNDPHRVTWLPFDVDLADAFDAYDRADLPAPNVFIGNPDNGHAHLAWALDTPVLLGDNARTAPMRYAEAVQRGMARRIGADAGYSGLIAKNPTHAHWRTRWLAPHAYSLADLAARLTSSEMRFTPTTVRDMGFIGRNVHVFNEVRTFAYREVRSFKKNGASVDQFCKRIERIASEVNLQFAAPLPPRELRSTARSISKWVWAHFSSTRFSEIQAQRSAKAAYARREKQEQTRAEITAYVGRERAERPQEVLLSDMGADTARLADIFRISRRSVYRHLAAIRRDTA